MPSYTVKFAKSAKKEFSKLPARIQDRVIEALEVLAINPHSELLKIKKLKGRNELCRIRIGDYRLVYAIEKSELIVLVVKIGHRREVYRDR